MHEPPKPRAGRPAIDRAKKRVKPNVTLDPQLIQAAKEKARERGIGISSFYEEALTREIARHLKEDPALLSDEGPVDSPKVIRYARPHIDAAAGSSITAEVSDWDGAEDTVLVRINGLSMSPLLNDGDVVSMHHKRTGRSPFMKKGLIYLVAYDGGFTVKRYNTRLATSEEIAEGISYISPRDGKTKVHVLESINPDFPEIVIKNAADWHAWIDPKKDLK